MFQVCGLCISSLSAGLKMDPLADVVLLPGEERVTGRFSWPLLGPISGAPSQGPHLRGPISGAPYELTTGSTLHFPLSTPVPITRCSAQCREQGCNGRESGAFHSLVMGQAMTVLFGSLIILNTETDSRSSQSHRIVLRNLLLTLILSSSSYWFSLQTRSSSTSVPSVELWKGRSSSPTTGSSSEAQRQ